MPKLFATASITGFAGIGAIKLSPASAKTPIQSQSESYWL